MTLYTPAVMTSEQRRPLVSPYGQGEIANFAGEKEACRGFNMRFGRRVAPSSVRAAARVGV